MKVLIILLAMLVAVPALSQIPVPRASFFESDPSLARYRLELPFAEQDAAEPDEKEIAPFWWRLAGYGVYAACGTMAVSSQYRKDRSFGGSSPLVNNDIARVFAIAGTAEGSNMGSEFFREKEQTRLAFMTRLGTLAACTYVAADNFNKGWKRR